MSAASRGILSVLSGMLARGSNQLFLIGVTLVATRMLTPADFGVFAIAATFVTLSRTLLYTGPFEYMMKAVDLKAVASACLAVTVLMVLFSAAAMGLIALAAPLIFKSQTVAILMLALIPSNAIAAVASWEEAQLLRSGRVQVYYIVTAGVEVISAGVAVALLLSGRGLFSLVAQIYTRLFLLAVIYRMMIAPPPWRWPAFSEIATVGRWSLARYSSTTVGFLSHYSGDLILGAVLSPAATGLYRASNRIVTAASDVFAQPAGLLAGTQLARRFARGAAPDDTFIRLFCGIAIFAWPALALMASLADRLTPLVLGKQWLAAAPVVTIICLARMVELVGTPSSAQLVSYDRQGVVLKNQLIASVSLAVLSLGAARFGVVAVALVNVFVALLSTTLLARAASRLGGVRRDVWVRAAVLVGAPTLLTLVAVWVGRILLSESLDQRPILFIAAATLCGMGGWLAGVSLFYRRALDAIHSLAEL